MQKKKNKKIKKYKKKITNTNKKGGRIKMKHNNI